MNNLQIAAKNFEEQVRSVLKLMGYATTSEILFEHKKVDLLVEEFRMGQRLITVVECKNYTKRLTISNVSKIYSEYHQLYDNRKVDQVLIVTQNGLSPAASAYIAKERGFVHQTLDELYYDVMDFDTYLTSVISDYEADGVSRYYVDVETVEGESVFDHIDNWLMQERSKCPLAILGSYGMGKSTLTKYSCHKLAKRHLANPSYRIPILIRLGDISTDQSLEGLLGREFTATHVVRNFSFQLFMELNRQGKFVIFLDGFDEMKHAMTWDEFKFNFTQLNRLVVGDSRVVLLGRPTAFLSDAEYQFCLHGKKLIKGSSIVDGEWPDYQEVQLAAFNREQVQQFLKRYFAYQKSLLDDKKSKRKIDDIVENQLTALSGKQLADIARRPVQLKILAEVLPQWNQDIDRLTVAGLYDFFIDMVIDREQMKLTRTLFCASERREFAKKLSYWLWTTDKRINITAEELPEFLFADYERKGYTEDVLRRDLVAACFLNRKMGGSLYFPHRSFQEFLVAECIIDKLTANDLGFSAVDKLVNNEVFDFLRGLVGENDIHSWQRGFATAKCNLSFQFLKMLNLNSAITKLYFEELTRVTHQWYILLVAMALNGNEKLEFNHRDFHERLQYMIAGCRDIVRIVMIFFCLLITYNDRDYKSSESYVLQIHFCIIEMCEIGKYYKKKDKHSQEYINITELLSRVNIYKSDFRMKGDAIDLGGVYKVILKILNQKCFVKNWISGNSIRIEGLELPNRLDSRDLPFIEELKEYQSENFV